MSALTNKLKKQAKALIPRFYREYKGSSDWWHSVKVDGKYYDFNFLTHDPDGTGEFPAKLRDAVKVVAYKVVEDKDGGLRQSDRGLIRLGYFKGKKIRRKFDDMDVEDNPPVARTKTWKLGEYGGNIKALVNQSGNAVKIMADGGETGEYEERLFRWPMDKFNMEMYLNDLTTSYYASKVIEWVDGVTKGTSMNPAPAGYHYMPDGKLMADSAHSVSKNPFSRESDRMKGYDDDRFDIEDKPLFKSGGYAVVITFKSGEVEIGQGISKDQAERQRKYLMNQYARLKLTRGSNNVSSIEVLPVTSVTKNPPR